MYRNERTHFLKKNLFELFPWHCLLGFEKRTKRKSKSHIGKNCISCIPVKVKANIIEVPDITVSYHGRIAQVWADAGIVNEPELKSFLKEPGIIYRYYNRFKPGISTAVNFPDRIPFFLIRCIKLQCKRIIFLRMIRKPSRFVKEA